MTDNVLCASSHCLTRVPRESVVFCSRHWDMLTPELQARVGRRHRFIAGYGPSREVGLAIGAAIIYLARRRAA